jgi:hypothetical protein
MPFKAKASAIIYEKPVNAVLQTPFKTKVSATGNNRRLRGLL